MFLLTLAALKGMDSTIINRLVNTINIIIEKIFSRIVLSAGRRNLLID